MSEGSLKLSVMNSKRMLRGDKDWAELCLYSKGKAVNFDITPTQFDVIAVVLGLADIEGEPESYVKLSDAQLESNVLPILEANVERFWASRKDGDVCTIAATS